MNKTKMYILKEDLSRLNAERVGPYIYNENEVNELNRHRLIEIEVNIVKPKYEILMSEEEFRRILTELRQTDIEQYIAENFTEVK